jgi:HSP20 family protein
MTMLLEPFDTLFEANRRRPGAWARGFLPATDLLVGEEEVQVVMDVPGFKADDLEIELADGVLTVRGERRYPTARTRPTSWIDSERGYGRFERVLQVPEDVEPGALGASMSDGVLTLSIPLPQARRPHRIEIGGGAGGEAIEATTGDGHAPEESVAESKGHRELAGSAA